MPDHPVIDSDGFIYELGWCAEHDDAAKRYEGDAPDYSCWWENIVETSGHHDPRDFVGIPGMRPVRWCLTHDKHADHSWGDSGRWVCDMCDQSGVMGEFVGGGLWLPKEQT